MSTTESTTASTSTSTTAETTAADSEASSTGGDELIPVEAIVQWADQGEFPGTLAIGGTMTIGDASCEIQPYSMPGARIMIDDNPAPTASAIEGRVALSGDTSSAAFQLLAPFANGTYSLADLGYIEIQCRDEVEQLPYEMFSLPDVDAWTTGDVTISNFDLANHTFTLDFHIVGAYVAPGGNPVEMAVDVHGQYVASP